MMTYFHFLFYMSVGEHKILHENNKHLIVCFGGMALQFGGILPFEFLKYLSSLYRDSCDLIFYIDHHQCWYHKGIEGITIDVDSTVSYLNDIIQRSSHYQKVIFLGTSAGGYASILFGSLCSRVDHVISFIPQTILHKGGSIANNYSNLKHVINEKTNYIVWGDTSIQDETDLHHILHCENLECFSNVKLIKTHGVNLKQLRDDGSIKKLIDDILFF